MKIREKRDTALKFDSKKLVSVVTQTQQPCLSNHFVFQVFVGYFVSSLNLS